MLQILRPLLPSSAQPQQLRGLGLVAGRRLEDQPTVATTTGSRELPLGLLGRSKGAPESQSLLSDTDYD